MSEEKSRPLRTALVGLQHGHMGTLDPASPRGLMGTFRLLAAGGEVTLSAVCEATSEAALAREVGFVPGARSYRSVDELLAGEAVDVAVVGLPAAEAAPAVAALAARGVHCFVEKSAARTADELLPVAEAAARSGAHVFIDYPWRHHPAMRAAADLLAKRTLGRPASILANMTTSQVGTQPGQRNPSGFAYRSESEGGGMLHWLGAHFLEAMCALMGDVEAVSAVCRPVIGNMEADDRMDDVSSVSLLFKNGAVGTLHTGYLNAVPGENRDFIRVWGTDGDAYWPGLGPELVVSARGGGVQTQKFEVPELAGVYGNKRWMFELAERFVQGIREGRAPVPGPAEALSVHRIVDAAYEASRTRRWVSLPAG